jgi:FAD-dependent halogenase
MHALTDAEIVVIGAGPAGTASAICLAQEGYRVAVVDRSKFPRFRIGESLPAKVDALLSILGVKAQVEQAGFARMRGTTVWSGDRMHTHVFDPEGGRLGYQVERARFDDLLLQRARNLGCEVSLETMVTDILVQDDGVRGLTVRRDDRTVEVTPRFVVDASGSHAVVARALGVREAEPIRTIAIAGYHRECRRPAGCSAHDTLFEMLREGWIWSVLRADGRRNVTVGLDADRVRGGRLEAEYSALIEASSLVGPLVQEARRDGELSTHDATWTGAARYAGPGFVLAGDAASFVDPLTSQGVFKALQSGLVAGAVIHTALDDPELSTMAFEHHQREQSRLRVGYGEVAISILRDSPYADSPFWQARLRPDFAVDDAQAQHERRSAFESAVTRLGGEGVRLFVESDVRVESTTVAEGGRIVQRLAWVGPGDRIVRLDGVDPAALRSVLDGRTMSEAFDGYAAVTGLRPAKALGRHLMVALTRLVARELVSFRV